MPDLKVPRLRKKNPSPLTMAQYEAWKRVRESDPPVVVASIVRSGFHYAVGNGGVLGKGMVKRLIERGIFMSNNDGMMQDYPQTYRAVDDISAILPSRLVAERNRSIKEQMRKQEEGV